MTRQIREHSRRLVSQKNYSNVTASRFRAAVGAGLERRVGVQVCAASIETTPAVCSLL
jgi:hypothetical protein